MTVYLIVFLFTLPFNPSATSNKAGSYSFSMCSITSFKIAVYTSPGLSESAKLTYLAPLSSLPKAA